ncbi:MAG: LysM peptidoglycan-binding domain-containing protein [Aggregatilineales bacterium]
MLENARNSASSIVAIMLALAFGFIAGRYSAPGNAPIQQSLTLQPLNQQSIFDPTPDPAQAIVTFPAENSGSVQTTSDGLTVIDLPGQSAPTATFILNADGTTVTHIVQEGESVFRISTQYGVDMQAIIDFNNLLDPGNIAVGQTLIIPLPIDYTPPPPTDIPPEVPTEVPTEAPTETATTIPTDIPPQPTATSTLTSTPQPIPTDTPTLTLTFTFTAPPPTPEANVTSAPVIVAVTAVDTPTNSPVIQPTAENVVAMNQALPENDELPVVLNGQTIDSFLVMDDVTRLNIREIYARGQTMGRNPRAFAKVGDSVIENPHFLARFDDPVTGYNLGNYGYLQTVIDYYQGSFGRQGLSVIRGLHSWNVNDVFWAGAGCVGGESPVACEFRLQNPSVAFIRLGSNDVGVPDSYNRNMRQLVEYTIAQGIIPILITKADRHEGSNINNELLRQIAADYHVPLCDFDLISATIPGRGLDGDGVHLNTFYAHDYTQAVALQRGHGVHNLTALMMLDRVYRVLYAPDGSG